MNKPRYLYAVELNITREANWEGGYRMKKGEYWVIHSEQDSDSYDHIEVFERRKEAQESARGRDHESRVVRFTRDSGKSVYKLTKELQKTHQELSRTSMKNGNLLADVARARNALGVLLDAHNSKSSKKWAAARKQALEAMRLL
jgi:hypothetical protein